MPHRHALALALVIALVAGCGDPAPTENPAVEQAAANARALAELGESIDVLANDVKRQGRQVATLSRDVALLTQAARGVPPADAADQDGGSDPDLAVSGSAGVAPPLDGDAPPDESAVAAILDTDAGRDAIAKAAAQALARRERQERRTFVSYSIARFAREAALDERESAELQRIWKESLDSGSELRERFAAVRRLPEAERADAREKAMEFMRSIGRERNDRVHALLGKEQFAAYGKTEEEIVGRLHGAPRRSAKEPAGDPSAGE